jgi:hypothetical protein
VPQLQLGYTINTDMGSYNACSIIDSNGNTFVLGYQSAISYISDSSGKTTNIRAAGGSIYKLDPTGKFLFIRVIPASYFVTGVIDSFGNIFVLARLNPSITNNAILDETNTPQGTIPYVFGSAGTTGTYLFKFDTNGTLLFSRAIINDYSDGNSIAIDSNNNIFIFIGQNLNAPISFNPSQSMTIPNTATSCVLCKFDSNGQLIAFKSITGVALSGRNKLACDSTNNIIVYTESTYNVQPRIDTTTIQTVTTSGYPSNLIIKFDNNLSSFSFVRIIETRGVFSDIKCDKNGNFFICFHAEISTAINQSIKNETGTVIGTIPELNGFTINKFDSTGTYKNSTVMYNAVPGGKLFTTGTRGDVISIDQNGNVWFQMRSYQASIKRKDGTLLNIVADPITNTSFCFVLGCIDGTTCDFKYGHQIEGYGNGWFCTISNLNTNKLILYLGGLTNTSYLIRNILTRSVISFTNTSPTGKNYFFEFK